jgi:xanthine dehydrogenase small subunit
MPRRVLRFLRRGRVISLSDFVPTTTILDWLRLDERSTGTKEGCAEGDCGACTVVVARLRDGQLVHEPVNACIALLGSLDGAELITVEDLADGGTLHPVQEAMVQHHGAQCGFCTPGIVMSLFALHHAHDGEMDRSRVENALAGNLCRCTGYKPIIAAALESCARPADDRFARNASARIAALVAMNDDRSLLIGDDNRFFAAPNTIDGLAGLLLRYPDAQLVAGATDVGLWITKGLRRFDQMVTVQRVSELGLIEENEDEIRFGAAVSLADAARILSALDADLGAMLDRFGSQQVRCAGTVGGNIGNGSPIGDLAPCLIALGATLEMRRGELIRSLPLEDFFLAYRKQDRAPGEFITRILVPRPGPQDLIRITKISKRRDEDISTMLMALRLTVDEGRIAVARLGFGGMAGIPCRASAAESVLKGQVLADAALWRRTAAALAEDLQPLSDLRASADYRMQVAQNSVIKALAEMAGIPSHLTRIVPRRETHHV